MRHNQLRMHWLVFVYKRKKKYSNKFTDVVYRRTVRQTNKEAGRQRGKRVGRQIDRETDRRTNGQTDRQTENTLFNHGSFEKKREIKLLINPFITI